MSTPRKRRRFQPRVVGAEGRAAVVARFRTEAATWGLLWRCDDCVFVKPSDGSCSLAWPNDALRPADPDVLDADDVPIFCKAFEPVCD